MNAWHRWATAGGLVLALSVGGTSSADPGGDELGGGEKESPGGGGPPPKAPDELGGGDKDPNAGGGGDIPKRPDDLGGEEKAPDTGGVVGGSDELGGGEPKEPPKEAPKEPPKEPPKEEPAKPPPTEPPAEPPPDTPPPPPPEPEPGSVDAEVAAAEKLKKEEERVKVLVQKFNQDMKKATPEEQQRYLTAISSTKHRLVALAMIPWIQPTVEDSVRDLAIEVAKGQRCPDIAVEAAKLFDKYIDNTRYARSMIGIIGRSKDVKQVTKLRQILKDKDKGYSFEIQKEVVIALGQIGHRDAIPDFIKMYKEFENPRLPTKEIPRKNALAKLVEENLELIAGVEMPNGKGWDMWWKENEKTFQKPAPGEGAPK